MASIPVPKTHEGVIDVLMKSIAYDEDLSTYHKNMDGTQDTVVTKRLDYLGFDFTVYSVQRKTGTSFYAVRLHPTKETYTATTPEQIKMSYAILCLYETSTMIGFWPSVADLEKAITEKRITLECA